MKEEISSEKRKSLAENYVTFLLKLKRNNGAMATLRRGLTENYNAVEMYRYVYSFLPEDHMFLSEKSFLQIAALFALHPETCKDKSFGKAFRELWHANNRGASIDSRFNALLATDKEMLMTHLHRAITMMKDKGIPIDYAGLLIDINNWEHEDGFVQKKWAKGFWWKNDNK